MDDFQQQHFDPEHRFSTRIFRPSSSNNNNAWYQFNQTDHYAHECSQNVRGTQRGRGNEPKFQFSMRPGREVQRCYNCGKHGHISRECPNTIMDVDESPQLAYLPPHPNAFMIRNNQYGGSDQRTCYNCGVIGHISRYCTETRLPPRNNGYGQRTANSHFNVCFNCGIYGHFSRDCRQPRKEQVSICFNCNEPGHFRANCPNF